MPLTRFTAPVRLTAALALATVFGASVALTLILLRQPAACSILIASAITLGALLADYARQSGPFSPLLPLFLAVLTSLTIPAWRGFFDRPGDLAVSQAANVWAALYFSLFVVIAVLVYRASAPRTGTASTGTVFAPWSIGRAWGAWAAALVVGAYGLERLVGSAGGSGKYLLGLSNRTIALAGQGSFLWLLLAPAGASLVLFAVHWSVHGPRGDHAKNFGASGIVLLIPFLVSGGFLLMTGNRMNVVVYIAASAYIRHRFWRPILGRSILVGVAVVLFFGLALPSLLRSGTALSDRSLRPVSLNEQYSSFGAVNTFGQAPALALAIQHNVPHTYGETYAAAATMFLPRSVAPWKLPDVGELVTKETVPSFWYHAGTGFQVGAPGEAYINFGAVGVIVVAIIAGLGLAGMRRIHRSDNPVAVMAYAIILPRAALYFRGGFATVTAYLLMDFAVIFLAITYSRKFPGHRADSSLGRQMDPPTDPPQRSVSSRRSR